MKNKTFLLKSLARGWSWLMMGLVTVGLAACGVPSVQPEPAADGVDKPVAVTRTLTLTAEQPAVSAEATENPAALYVRSLLAQQLQTDATAIHIVSAEPVTWPDACLGQPDPAELCAPEETSGYKLTLEANGGRYLYHTDAAADRRRLVEAPEPAVGEKIIVWSGTGDQDECRETIIGLDGVAFGRCGRALLGGKFGFDTRQADLTELAGRYASFQADTPAGAVTFTGSGSQTATPAEQRMIAEWARLVSLEAEAGRSGASWGLALAWHREGGLAGFCDDVAVYVTGEATVSSCRAEPPVDIGRVRLDAAQLATLYNWLDALAPFEQEYSDPAAAEAMTIQIVFSGTGTQENIEPEWLLISDFAQTLYNETTMQAASPPEVCPVPTADQQILVSQEEGYCFLYPAHYSLVQPNPHSLELVIDTVMNYIDPRLSISVEAAAGRSLADKSQHKFQNVI